MGSVGIRVLGPVVAEVEGDAVSPGGPQQRALLAALTIDVGSVVGRDGIVDRLWPDDPPASAAKLVHKYVSGLRSLIGHRAIETSAGGYRLALEPSDIDVVRWGAVVADIGRGDGDERRADELWELAEREWRGPPYSGCGEPPFVIAERLRLTRRRLEARLDHLARRIDEGAFGSAVPELERLAVEHPEHERVVGLLMTGLYATDRQVDALRAYRRLSHHLRDELGLEPSPELRELETRILTHDDALRPPPAARADRRPTVGAVATSPEPVTGGEAVVEERVEEIRPVVIVHVRDPSPSPDPEDVRAHHRDLVRGIGDIARRAGASVERAVDDEVVLLLGVPARDHDAQRAVSIAQEIVADRPSSHVAVVADDALVTLEPDVELVAGTLVQRARTLGSSARPGEPELGPEVVARLAAPDDPPEPAFVGRDDEFDVVDAVWGRVRDDRRLRVVDVIGEAGIGKTRFVAEAVDRLRPGPELVVRLGYWAPGDGELFAALRSSIEELSTGFATIEGWLSTFGLSGDHCTRLAAQLRPFLEPTASPSDGSDDWASSITRLFDVLAARGPIVVVVEDLHWGRPESIDRLNESIVDVADRPILVLLTRRPEPPSADLDLRAAAEAVSMSIGPLADVAIRALAADVRGNLDDEALQLAVDRSGGSPLFLVQYVRMLLDRPGASARRAPESVRLVISTRIDHLAAPLRRVVRLASFMPDRITAAAIAAISERDEGEVSAGLKLLARAGLLRRSPSERPSRESSYSFQHHLVADVTYGQLTRATQLDVHRRVGRWFDAIADPTLDELQSSVWHWDRVVSLAPVEHGHVDPDDADRARWARWRAGDRLLAVDAGLARRSFEGALALAPEGSIERARILLRLGEIMTTAGDFEPALAVLREAASVFDELGEPAGAGEALARLGRTAWFLGRGGEAQRLVTESLERLDRTPATHHHAHALVIAAAQASLDGRASDAMGIVERAEPIVRRWGSEHDAIRLLQVRGFSRFDRDDVDAIEDLEEAHRRAVESGSAFLTCQTSNNLAEMVWPERGPRRAVEIAEAGRELAIECGFLGQAAWNVEQLCALRFDLGEWDAVLEMDAADSPSTPAAGPPATAYAGRSVHVGRVTYWRDLDDGSTIAAALDSLRPSRDVQVLGPVLAASLFVAALDDRAELAGALAEELIELTAGRPAEQLRSPADAARGLCWIDRVDLARRLGPAERPRVRRRQLMWESVQGSIAAAERRDDDALELLAAAESGWELFPHPFEAAQAARELARVEQRVGRLADAAATRRRATERFTALGAVRALAAGSDGVM